MSQIKSCTLCKISFYSNYKVYHIRFIKRLQAIMNLSFEIKSKSTTFLSHYPSSVHFYHSPSSVADYHNISLSTSVSLSTVVRHQLFSFIVHNYHSSSSIISITHHHQSSLPLIIIIHHNQSSSSFIIITLHHHSSLSFFIIGHHVKKCSYRYLHSLVRTDKLDS